MGLALNTPTYIGILSWCDVDLQDIIPSVDDVESDAAANRQPNNNSSTPPQRKAFIRTTNNKPLRCSRASR